MSTVDDSPRIHELKTLPHYFRCVAAGLKSFEVRLDDRNFCVGDLLRLQEFEPVVGYTGRIVEKTIGYILSGGQFGIERGYVVLGFCESTEFSRLRVQERRADELAKQIERTDGLLKRFRAFVAEHIDAGRWAGYDIYTAVITEWIERDQQIDTMQTQLSAEKGRTDWLAKELEDARQIVRNLDEEAAMNKKLAEQQLTRANEQLEGMRAALIRTQDLFTLIEREFPAAIHFVRFIVAKKEVEAALATPAGAATSGAEKL